MKTNVMRTAVEWPTGKTGSQSLAVMSLRQTGSRLRKARQYGMRLALALLPSLAVIIATIWAVDAYETPRVLQALIWAAGFVFLALAMESRKLNVGALMATGLALPVLAVLSSRVAAEFAIIAAVLVSAWIIRAIVRH